MSPRAESTPRASVGAHTEQARHPLTGRRVRHPRHGRGRVVAGALVPGCVLVAWRDCSPGCARVAAVSDLEVLP